MGAYNIVGKEEIQIKMLNNPNMKRYSLGDLIDLPEGLYIGYEGWFVVEQKRIILTGMDIYDKWGNFIDTAEILNPRDEIANIVIMKEWEVSKVGDPYTPPECMDLVLYGKVYGHKRFPNGHVVRTSAIKSFDGRCIKTHSGTTYYLKEPSEKYREWLRVNRPNWDPENPFTYIK